MNKKKRIESILNSATLYNMAILDETTVEKIVKDNSEPIYILESEFNELKDNAFQGKIHGIFIEKMEEFLEFYNLLRKDDYVNKMNIKRQTKPKGCLINGIFYETGAEAVRDLIMRRIIKSNDFPKGVNAHEWLNRNQKKFGYTYKRV